MPADAQQHRQICVGCGTKSPEIETDYTLISARFGWRLRRVEVRGGEPRLEWYCPACWAKKKAERLAQGEPAPTSDPASTVRRK